MTAPNHALTGALIGFSVQEPLLAAPLAFVSHFVCDAIPHYDPPGGGGVEAHISKRFIYEQLVLGAGLCLLLVVCLAVTRPRNWLLAAICAFLAASPDLFWLPRFIFELRTHNNRPPKSAIMRFHAWIQWRTGPKLWWIEALWAIGCISLLIIKIN